MLDSAIGSITQAFRPNLGAVYVGVVSVLCWATLADDAGPLTALSKGWTYLTDRPGSYLVDAQSWMNQHSDLVGPVSWALLLTAAVLLNLQGVSAFSTKAGATSLLAVMALVSLQVSATLLLVVLSVCTMGVALLRWALRRSELDMREAFEDAWYGLGSVFFIPWYIVIVLGVWLFGDIGGTSPKKDGVQPRHLKDLTDQVRRIADAKPRASSDVPRDSSWLART